MRILVLGAGGIGGYFGGRLAEAGVDVTFLLRPARAKLIADKGLRIASPLGDATLQVKTATADTVTPDYDVALLTCKAYDLDDAIASLKPGVGPDTVVIPLLNGLAHYEKLDAAFGPERVLGGLVHAPLTLDAEGVVRHLGTLQRLTFGERAGGTSPRTEAVAAVLGRASFEMIHSPAVMQEAWEKWSFLAPLAGITCMMRGSIGQVAATAEGAAITLELLAECEAVAAASGYPVRPAAHDFSAARLTEAGSSFTASMLRDMEQSGRIEGDHLLGDLLRRAAGFGIATPVLRLAVCHYQTYEQRAFSSSRT